MSYCLGVGTVCVICSVNVKSISSYFSLQNYKCLFDIGNTKNNNNFEIIKVICNFEKFYVHTLYCLKRTFIHSLKNGVGLSPRGLQTVGLFSIWVFTGGLFYTLHDEKLVQDILEKGSTKKLFV